MILGIKNRAWWNYGLSALYLKWYLSTDFRTRQTASVCI